MVRLLGMGKQGLHLKKTHIPIFFENMIQYARCLGGRVGCGFFFFFLIIYLHLFLVVLGLLSIHRLSLVAVSGGYSLIAMHRLLLTVVSLFCKAQAPEHRLSSCGTQA